MQYVNLLVGVLYRVLDIMFIYVHPTESTNLF